MDSETNVLYGHIFCFFNPASDSILNVEGFCEESAYPLEYDRVKRAILDWTGALFVIEPKSAYSSRQEYLSFVSDNVLALFDSSTAIDGHPSELHEQAAIRKGQMMQRVAFELEAAASNCDQHIGQAVKYGDVVQLRHVNSGRYYCAKASGTDGSTEFAVVDAVEAVENSYWQIFSSTRQVGNVKYAVDMQLRSVVYDALMTVGMGPTGAVKYVVSAEVNAQSTFQLVRLADDKKQSKRLCVGDCVNISHFSSSKMLTSRYGDFQKFYEVDNQSASVTANHLFAPARACFVVESGGVFEPLKTSVQSDQSVRLRCVCTGEMLALASHVGPEPVTEDMFNDDASKPLIVCTIQASPTIIEDTTFCLPGISDHASISDSCFQIMHVASNTRLAILPKNGHPILAPNFAESGNNAFFRCAIANPVVVQECRRLASFKSIFEYLIALIGLEVSMSAEVVSTATHHFEGLARWLNDASPQLRMWRQEGLLDNGCVDLLRTLLGAPMEICKMPLSAIVKQQRYRHVCSFISSCGNCIEAVVTNCPQNGSRFLSWIESLIEVMACFESVAKVILACFVCSKGASRILKIQHIHAIVELSKGPARTRLYHSLSQLLMKGGDDSIRCQDFLLSKFFPSPAERESLGNTREVVPSLRADGKIIVVVDITSDRTPQPLDTVLNSPALYGSLCGFLELTDALCHNYCDRALKELLAIDIIPYRVGISILNDSYVPFLLKLRVLKVMHRLYVLTVSTRALDCSKFELLIPWTPEDSVSRYSASNVYPDHASWESTIDLQDVVLRTIESNDSLGFDADKDAFTAAALSVAASFCRIGTFCMPIDTVVKSAAPYFQTRAQAFANSKVVERDKALRISTNDATASSGVFLQLELLLQPLQMLLDTSTDNTKGAARVEAADCKTEAMRCIDVVLGIRRHLQILQSLKRFSEDIAASKVSKNVDMLKFTPSAITVEPLALQMIQINMTTLPATLTNLFCHPRNTKRLDTLELIVTLFLDSVLFFKNARSVLLLSDPLIILFHRMVNDFTKLMSHEFSNAIAMLSKSSMCGEGHAPSSHNLLADGEKSHLADFVLRFQQLAELVVRPISLCTSAEVLKKMHLVSQQLCLADVIMTGMSDILSIFAPIKRHESSDVSASMRKVTPRPLSSRSAHFTDFHKKLVDSMCQIIIKLCPGNPVTQKFFFAHMDSLIKMLQLYSDDADSRVFVDAVSAVLQGNRDLCILSQDVLIPDLIILLLRKGKWQNILVLLRVCVTHVESPALAGVQKAIMLGLIRNYVMLVQLPVNDLTVFSQRTVDLKESSVGYTIECLRLLSRLCTNNLQNQSTVRCWIPIAEVTSVLRRNLKNHLLSATYIDLVAAAYLVHSFDVSSEYAHAQDILVVFGEILQMFCETNAIHVIPDKSFVNDVSIAAGTRSTVLEPGAAFSLNTPSPLLDSVVMFLVAMFKSYQSAHVFTSSIQSISRQLISIICDRACMMAQKVTVKRLLDHVFASKMLPTSIIQLYGSLPAQFEANTDSDALFLKPDDSASSLWPYFLNQEYGVYLKDESECVAMLVKHFKDPAFANTAREFEAHLIWAIQQVSLPNETRSVLIKVTHSLWKTSDTAMPISRLRVLFSILCDLLVEFEDDDRPIDVHVAAISFCTDLFSSSETRKLFQGEFYDTVKSYGTVCVAAIQKILDSAVYYGEEYSRRCSTSLSGAANNSNSQEHFLSFCQELLILLKSFCEGHFSEGQAFVGQALGSLNVINLTSQLLLALSSAHSNLAHSLQLSSLDFLVESIQGPCLQNCAVALNSRICAAFNSYIRLEQYSHEYPVMPSDISMERLEKFFVFFQAMLEETRTDTSSKPLYRSVVNFILANIDFAQILAFLENACSLMLSSNVLNNPEKVLMLKHLCSNIFVLLTYLGASSPDSPTILKQFCTGFRLEKNLGFSNAAVARWEAFIAEFWNGIVSIEIFRDGNLCQVYFYSRPSPSKHQEAMRVSASLDFGNEHPQGRLLSFLQNIDQMHYELKHLSQISTRPLLALLMSMHNFFYYGRYFSVIFVNLLMVLTYRYQANDEYETGESVKFAVLENPGTTAEVARGPCVFFNFICYVYLLVHLGIIDGLPIIRSRLRSALHIDTPSLKWVLFRDCSLSLGMDMKGPFHVVHCILALFSHTRFFILGICCLLCLYMVSDQNNGFSTIAMAPLLLELISTSKLVQLAVSSVTKRWQLLCQVSIGTVLFVYWCSCVIFVFFYDDLEFSVSRVVDGQSPPPNQNEYFVAPRYLWKCFVFVLDSSLRTQDIGKAFGIVQSSTSDNVLLNLPQARLFIRIVISFIFWFVFQLIFLRVFPGVISDTFKDNRVKNQLVKAARLSKCFICGLQSHDFILTGSSFDHHVRHEHAPYSYVQYFVYLAEKDPNDYTGLESYVVNCILASNVEFLPIGTCLSTQHSALRGRAAATDGTVDDFQTRLNGILQQQNGLEVDWAHHGRFTRRSAVSFAGIAEIREEYRKRAYVLKANPFVVESG